MRGRKAQFLFKILLVLIVFGLGTRIVNAAEENDGEISEQDMDILQEEVQDALLAEFDFDEIEKSLNRMFPQEKITFSEVVSSLLSGNMEETAGVFFRFLADQVFYEFDYNRRSLVYMILTALTAAIFSNFAGAFKSRQIADIT